MFKHILLGCLAVLLIFGCFNMASAKSCNCKWDKVFPKSDKVNVERVTFKTDSGLN